jgi:Flp pilus assembly protein TadD
LIEAERCYESILRQDARNTDVLRLLGILTNQTGQHDRAAQLIRRAIATQPRRADLHALLAEACVAQGRPEQAIAAYRAALQLEPSLTVAQNGLGELLLVHADDTIGYFEHIVEISPDNTDARLKLGSLLVERGDVRDGATHLERVVHDAPELARAHVHLGLALLQMGDFQRGWSEFRWRHQFSVVTATGTGNGSTAWDGRLLNGRSIVLLPEQGFGDTIQFARYAPLVRARGGQVILGCPLPLKRLLKTLEGVSQIASGDDPAVTADMYAPLLDLPAIFGTDMHNVPAEIPYLHAEPALARAWAERLTSSLLRVGLVWAGNPDHKQDARRSMSPLSLAPLGGVAGVQFFSLQKGPSSAQHAPPPGLTLTDLGPALDDFADTAAALTHLDLIITVDTAVAHLAGALGRPVWLLLARGHDWRWIDGLERSPWYPTMRIFRQDVPGGWVSLVQRVAAELRQATAVLVRTATSARP